MAEDLNTLFRVEVVASRQIRLEGDVLLSLPLRARVIVAILCCSMTALTVWIITGSYSRIELAKGILVTDVEAAKVVALHPGVVTQLSVKEGQFVHKGELLVTIQVDQQYRSGSRTTEESISAIAAQQELASEQIGASIKRRNSEQSALRAAISSARQQFGQVGSQIAIQKQLITSFQAAYARYGPIAEKGFISQTEMDRHKQDLLGAQAELARLEQQQTTLHADWVKAAAAATQADAEQSAASATARSSSEGFRVQEAQLRGQQSYVLVAPNEGVVTAIQSGVGRTVDANLPLMTIIPLRPRLHAELYAPTKAVGFVHRGQEVRLLYDAFPYERFGSFAARVSTISKVALDPRQIDTPFRVDEPVYRISVVPDRQTVTGYGDKVKLQPGMTLSANLVLERRSFLGWLLEPLRAVTRRDH